MKHVCPCRACGLTTARIDKRLSKGTVTLFYWYQYYCGLSAGAATRKSRARHYWNKDNAEAQNLRELTSTLKSMVALLRKGWEHMEEHEACKRKKNTS